MIDYDHQADILYVTLSPELIARSVEREWGLIDLNDAGKPVGLEYWDASDHFPGEFLDLLPKPEKTRTAADAPLRVAGQSR